MTSICLFIPRVDSTAMTGMRLRGGVAFNFPLLDNLVGMFNGTHKENVSFSENDAASGLQEISITVPKTPARDSTSYQKPHDKRSEDSAAPPRAFGRFDVNAPIPTDQVAGVPIARQFHDAGSGPELTFATPNTRSWMSWSGRTIG